MIHQPQPRRYRVRLMRGHRHALDGQEYMAVLDLTDGPGLAAAHAELGQLVAALAYADGARGERALAYSLAVHDWDTDQLVCRWPARTYAADW